MKNSMFKLIALMLIASVAITTLAACSNDSGVSSGDDTTAADTTAAENAEPEEEYSLANYIEKQDLGGMTYRIFETGEVQIAAIYVEEETGSLIDDSVYKKIVSVEEHLGCDIQLSSMAKFDTTADGGVIKATILSGEHEFDLVQGHDITMAQNSLEHCYVNLLELDSFNFDAPWYSQKTIDSLRAGDVMYLLSCDASYYGTNDMRAWFYNKDMAADYGLDNLYKVVDDGDWTFDYMNEQVKKVYTDSNGNNERDAEDIYGYAQQNTYYGFVEGLGIEHFVKDSDGRISYEFDLNKNLRAVEAVYDLLFTSGGGFCAENETVKRDMFCAEQVLFVYDKMQGAVKNYSFSDVSYGVLPMPKLTDDADGYIGGRTDRPMAIPMTVPLEDLEKVALITEAMTIEGYHTVFPAYYEVALKTRYADNNDDARMLDIVHDNVVLSFTYIYGGYDSTYMKLMATHLNPENPSTDVASFAASKEESMKKLAETINEAFFGE